LARELLRSAAADRHAQAHVAGLLGEAAGLVDEAIGNELGLGGGSAPGAALARGHEHGVVASARRGGQADVGAGAEAFG
jgi:hypothetical protein